MTKFSLHLALVVHNFVIFLNPRSTLNWRPLCMSFENVDTYERYWSTSRCSLLKFLHDRQKIATSSNIVRWRDCAHHHLALSSTLKQPFFTSETMPNVAVPDTTFSSLVRSISRSNSSEELPLTIDDTPVSQPLPFRQNFLWSASLLLFSTYLTVVLYFFLTSAQFRYFVVHRANTLFAVPYVLSLLVVLLCLAPCSPTAPRAQLEAVISSPSDCVLVLLILLEWATCLALVLVTLMAVHDHLSYVSPDGLIVPTDTVPSSSNKLPPHPCEGISHDAIFVLIVPLFLMYCTLNCMIHLYSCLEAIWRNRHNYTDLDWFILE